MDSFTVAYILSAIIIGIGLYSKWRHSYWNRLGLENPQPEFIFGNTGKYLRWKLAFGDQFKIIYNELKSRGLKHGGCYLFFRAIYMPIDLDLIKCILQKDFNHFVNHGIYSNEKDNPLSGNLLNLEDERWKNLRARLTPTFTPGKLKIMSQTLISCGSGLEDILKDHSITREAVDVKDVVSRFTVDVIGSVAFGINCNSLKNRDSEFHYWGKKIAEQTFLRRIKITIALSMPTNILRFLGYTSVPRDVENFFLNVVKETIQYRESNNVHRNDFMQLMLQLKDRGELADEENDNRNSKNKGSHQLLTFNELAAQCFVFFSAGFETSATTLTFALLELALNHNIQDKLREEIKTVLKKHDGQVTHDGIMSMDYLDKVIHETLRKHPPIPVFPRVCNKAYKVPDTNVVMEVGTRVYIPTQAIHWDPEYYPEPEKFDPERFNEENKLGRHPFAFLPFGEGPRICLGARFAFLEIKVGIIAIIQNFKVNLSDKMKFPIKYAASEFVSTVEGGVWLNVTKIE